MIEPLKAVYSYYFKEVRDIITEIVREYPHDVFLQSVHPGLDDFHKPIIKSYLHHIQNQLPDLSNFSYQYVTTGSEGIFHTLSEILAFKKDTPLYVFAGEYEGYTGYGNNLGLEFNVVNYSDDFSKLTPGIFFISNPSAKDGNLLPNNLLEKIGQCGHEIILDVTYVGLTQPIQIFADKPYISKVIVSLSKPFGLYYYRIGFMFSRQPMPTLEVNKWFKNIFSLIIADKVISQIPASSLVQKYRPWQQRAVQELSLQWGIDVKPSQVLLLAHVHISNVPENLRPKLEKYRRDDTYRFCLTPFFLDYEKD